MLCVVGSRLLTGGEVIQMWQAPEPPSQEVGSVEFYIEDTGTGAGQGEEQLPDWRCMWHCRPATAIHQLKFSPDGLLFASVGKVHNFISYNTLLNSRTKMYLSVKICIYLITQKLKHYIMRVNNKE